MRNLQLGIVLLVSVLSISGTPSWGEEPIGSPMAILNVDKVFRTYKPLQERMRPLKEKAKELDKSMQLKQVEIETTQNKIRLTAPGSEPFEKLQVALAKMQTELRLFVEREKNNLRKEEADIYVGVYQEMEVEVKKICEERKIRLVLRQNEGAARHENPDEILKWLNRPIVFEDNLNITDLVIEAMSKSSEKNEE